MDGRIQRSTLSRFATMLTLVSGLAIAPIAATASAQTNRRILSARAQPSSVSPQQDDAALHDVHFVGERRGWAVGDRGVIWRTDDGGRSWDLLASGIDCSLRSVCFLTDRVGWVVGGGITPHVGTTYGIVLSTNDGGETWSLIADRNVPLLHKVQFFGLDEGMAVCETSARFPSGVLQTSDGGKTWEPVAGSASDNWRTAAFVNENMGVVAGRLGRFTSVGAGQVMPPLTGAAGLKGFADVCLQADGHGWMAGDGGLVLTSDDAVAWRSPSTGLPRGLRDAMDFKAVAMRDDHVWLAGVPGSVIWHSPDGGQSWRSHPTGNTTPIAAMHFASPTQGWAVGAMGSILTTTDGGQTWSPSRAAPRRAAILAIHAHESRVSLNLTTKYGLEEGYRTALTLMSRRDIGPDAEDGCTLDLRLSDAVTAAGGAAATVDWAFPVAAPELDHHAKELVREWQLLTDNRLREVMLSRLVVQLRTWRPDVLIVDTPPTDDATTTLLADAVKLAIQQAAGEHEGNDLTTLLHLPPWQVKRAYQRQLTGSAGDIVVDAFEFLPRQGATVEMSAADAVGRLGMPNVTSGKRESYEFWKVAGLPADVPGRDFFAGLVLSPGSDARRELASIDDRDLERGQNLANQQRNFAAYTERMLDDERHAAQIIGQTTDVIGGAPPEQAAVQLARLAEEYRRRGQWEHTQTTLFELVERHPDQPAALDALRWLFYFTSSSEVGWQRLRDSSSARRTEIRIDENLVQASIRDAISQARSGNDDAVESEAASAVRQTAASAALSLGNSSQHAAKLNQWQSQAERVVEILKRANPAYFDEPAIQFPLAAFERARKHPRDADAIVNRFLSGTGGGPWNQIAAGEVWIMQSASMPPGKVALCHRVGTAPYLDGNLNDPCWQQTVRIPLKNDAEHQRPRSMTEEELSHRSYVQLAYDSGFLYLAARFRRVGGVSSDRVELPGRSDDADLAGQDRLSLQLDVDRDYATYYRFDIDQRGWTTDACWENQAWNAERFIAADGDSSEWRIEMAIPFTELVAQSPRSGDTWAAALVRVLPTVEVESWTPVAGTSPQPEGFGLLRFE